MAGFNLEHYIWFLAYLIGYIITGAIGSLFIKQKKKKAKLRWTLSPLKPFMSKNFVIVLSLAQFGIAFILSLFISGYIFSLLESTIDYIYPVSLIAFTTTYLSIRQNLPYNFTLKESLSVILLYAVSALMIFLIYRYRWFF